MEQLAERIITLESKVCSRLIIQNLRTVRVELFKPTSGDIIVAGAVRPSLSTKIIPEPVITGGIMQGQKE